MDSTTIIGILAVVSLVVAGLVTGELSSVFLNVHGIAVVFGGTFAATLVNTPVRYVKRSIKAIFGLLRKWPYADPAAMIPVMVHMAEQAQTQGLAVFRNAQADVAGGFLAHAAEIALEHNDPAFVRKILTDEINQGYDFENEITNLFRTMSILAPMFGLIGTLIGIVHVLQEISDPEAVGPAMAVAITSAFYGILFANLLCVPVAGKLRIRTWEETQAKSLLMEGVIAVMEGTVPIVVERRLQSFLM